MVSNIPLMNPKPNFNIAPMHVTTELGAFKMSSGAEQLRSNLVKHSYNELRERITQVASTQATMMGKMKSIGSHWQFVCIIYGA